jgi:8-oxo-dGTP pyrophosphatase MutT (NUDIX family)
MRLAQHARDLLTHGRLGSLSVVTAGEPVSRLAGRVLVIDADGRVLLLHGYDPAEPGRPYWFTVGGGAQHGESLAEAAVRELREETGLTAGPGDLGEPVWHEVAEFSYDGTRYRQEQDFFLLRVGSPDVSGDGRDDEEAAVIDGHRWWTLSELEATAESYYPPELPGLLRALG